MADTYAIKDSKKFGPFECYKATIDSSGKLNVYDPFGLVFTRDLHKYGPEIDSDEVLSDLVWHVWPGTAREIVNWLIKIIY